MAVALEESPYDDITSDDLFDSFMDVVSGVELEQSFNGGEQHDNDDENTYEDVASYTTTTPKTTDVHSSTPSEPTVFNVPTDQQHLPLLVKMSAEPIYEVCSKRPLPAGALISDLDDDDDYEETAPHVQNNGGCLNGISVGSADIQGVTSYSSLRASVSADVKTDDEYATVDKLRKSTTTLDETNNNNLTSRDLEELHKKIHALRQKSLSSSNIEVENSSSVNYSISPTSVSPTNCPRNSNHHDINNKNIIRTGSQQGSRTSINSGDELLERSASRRSNASDIVYGSSSNISMGVRGRSTESDTESIGGGLRRCNTNSSSTSSCGGYTSVEDLRGGDRGDVVGEAIFTAEQIAYGFRKARVTNGSAQPSQPSAVKNQLAKDKRNFFGFSKKGNDESR